MNKREKKQINLHFSEREYLKLKVKDTNKRVIYQIYLWKSVRENLKPKNKGIK